MTTVDIGGRKLSRKAPTPGTFSDVPAEAVHHERRIYGVLDLPLIGAASHANKVRLFREPSPYSDSGAP
jgi:hypothetical protein